MPLNDDILKIFEDPSILKAQVEHAMESSKVELIELDLADMRRKLDGIDQDLSYMLCLLSELHGTSRTRQATL